MTKTSEHEERLFALGAEIQALRDDLTKADVEIERLRAALKPFAEITPSSLYADADNEMYGVYVTDVATEEDFSRVDLIRAKEAYNGK